jgi:hypothetical protein
MEALAKKVIGRLVKKFRGVADRPVSVYNEEEKFTSLIYKFDLPSG